MALIAHRAGMTGPANSSPSIKRAPDGTLPLFRPRRRGLFAPLARAVSWHRRKLAVLAAVAAVLCTISALSPTAPPTVAVVVAARDLTGGQTLASADLRLARYPPDLAPADALSDPSLLEGRVLIGAAGNGVPLGRSAVVAPRDLSPGAGRSMVPVRLTDPAVAGLLQVGDVIDVLVTSRSDAPTRAIAAGARVLAFPAQETAEGPFGAASGPTGRLVLLEVAPEEALELVAAQSRDQLAVILR